jgi:DNA-binding LacI/PurR family transcriptional regulator
VETPDVEGLLQHEDPPSAIIAANNRMALGVIAAAIDPHILCVPRIPSTALTSRVVLPVVRP